MKRRSARDRRIHAAIERAMGVERVREREEIEAEEKPPFAPPY
jgi:hypothetical protein